MKKIFAVIILLCITYFIGGYLAVILGLISQNQYQTYTGIFGGLASVVGLFSLIKPAFTKNDLQLLELETIKSLSETAEQLKTLEQKRLQTKNEIGDLEIRKKEMELLVKKATMSLFLKEQYLQHENKILSRLKADNSILESLTQIEEIKGKLKALEEEINGDANVEILKEVIMAANRRQDVLEEIVGTMPALFQILYFFSRELSKTFSSTFKIFK